MASKKLCATSNESRIPLKPNDTTTRLARMKRQCSAMAASAGLTHRAYMCDENRNTHVVFRKGVFKLNHNRLSLLNVLNLFEIHKPLLVKILCFPGIENTVHTHTNDRHHVDTTGTSIKHMHTQSHFSKWHIIETTQTSEAMAALM